MTDVTNPALSAKGKQMVLMAMQIYRDEFMIARDKVTDEDEIADLDMDITYANSMIKIIQSWKVKTP